MQLLAAASPLQPTFPSAISKVGPVELAAIADHLALSSTKALTAPYASELQPTVVEPLVEDSAASGPISPKDISKGKLERLIWLQLHCMAEKGSVPEEQGSNAEPKQAAVATEVCMPDAAPSMKEHEPSSDSREDDDSGSGENAALLSPANAAAFSCGSVGHPEKCSAPCKYFRKKRGCMDGLACSHCHLCVWRPVRSQRGRRGAKSESVAQTDGAVGVDDSPADRVFL